MTLPADAANAIYSRFLSQWGTTVPSTLENEPFDPAEDDPWIEVFIRHTDSNFETLGAVGDRRVRREGSIFMRVYTPGGEGTTESRTLAKQAADIFEGVTFTSGTDRVDCNDAVIREVGPDRSWFLTMVEVFFAYEERK